MPVPKQARNNTYQNNYGYQRLTSQSDSRSSNPYRYPQQNAATPIRPQARPQARPHLQPQAQPHIQPLPQRRVLRKKKTNPVAQFISFAILALLAIYVLPVGYERISKPFIFGPNYQEVKLNHHDLMRGKFFDGTDTQELLTPTINYLSNDLFLNTHLLTPAKHKKPEMTTLYTTDKMAVLEAKLQKLMMQYKTIDPSIFVWDYDTGKFVDIKASQPYSAASIIKIPVLIQLFKSIEANQLTIYDEMDMTNYFKSEGSGDLQFKGVDAKYTIDELARAMITQSDNSATNMLMTAVGSMTDVNAGIRGWGLKNTHINNWLPDIAGTNYTTAKDLATMLYNLDNPGFLNINSREYMIDYMSHVENNRLIQAGLDPKALFVHKTGDIGKMLGDAGIVYAPNGKKYIVAILANRPYNAPQGKDFIQQASKIIYSNMLSGAY